MISRHMSQTVKPYFFPCFTFGPQTPTLLGCFTAQTPPIWQGPPCHKAKEEFGTLFMVVFIIFCRLYPHVLPVLFPCLKKLLASPDSWGNPKMFNCLAINWNQHSMLTGSFKQHERIYTIWGFWPNGWIIDSSDQKFALSGIYIHSQMCLYSLMLHEGNPPKR